MSLEELLTRLELVRRCGRGWMARCPAHMDKSPSLSICIAEDGLILMHCFAGCAVEQICASLGLTMRHLFPDSGPPPRSRPRVQPERWRFDWRQAASDFQDHALALQLRAESVLQAAKDLETSEWTATDFDAATEAVGRASADREKAEHLEETAFRLRFKGLTNERNLDATGSRVAQSARSGAVEHR